MSGIDALIDTAARLTLEIAALRAQLAERDAVIAEAREALDSVSAEPDLSLTDRLAIRNAIARIDALDRVTPPPQS